jgi:apolipoprotein N-acyltransferase
VRSRLAAPLLSGILLAAATPPALSPLLPFVALAPLAVHLARLPSAGAGARAFEAGVIAAAVQHGWGLRWLPGTLIAVAGPAAGVVATLAVLLTLAAFGGAAAWCVRRLASGGRPLPIAVALAWTALDWTLAHLPLGLAFPWAPLGLGLTRWPATLGLAALVGAIGVTAWLALVNGLAAVALLAWIGGEGARPAHGRRAATTLAGAALLALTPIGWSAWRAAAPPESAAPATVLALALDVPPVGAAEARARAAVVAAEGLITGRSDGADLIVLPEMALPIDVDSRVGESLAGRLRDASPLGAPVLVGARTTRDGRAYNSALLLSDRRVGVDKRRLVPGAERGTALAPAWLAPSATGYAAGGDPSVLRAGPLSAGVLICWEVAFAEDVRGLVRSGAGVLVVLSNDAWFGGSGAARAAGVAQQVAHLALRALETRTGAVRSSNGGPAAQVDPRGSVRLAAPTEALLALVPVGGPATLFVRTGDWIGPLALIALVLALAGTRLADPSGRESEKPPRRK